MSVQWSKVARAGDKGRMACMHSRLGDRRCRVVLRRVESYRCWSIPRPPGCTAHPSTRSPSSCPGHRRWSKQGREAGKRKIRDDVRESGDSAAVSPSPPLLPSSLPRLPISHSSPYDVVDSSRSGRLRSARSVLKRGRVQRHGAARIGVNAPSARSGKRKGEKGEQSAKNSEETHGGGKERGKWKGE